MIEGKVKQWCHEFNGSHLNSHNEKRSGRPSIQIDNFAENVNVEVRENFRFKLIDLFIEFP